MTVLRLLIVACILLLLFGPDRRLPAQTVSPAPFSVAGAGTEVFPAQAAQAQG